MPCYAVRTFSPCAARSLASIVSMVLLAAGVLPTVLAIARLPVSGLRSAGQPPAQPREGVWPMKLAAAAFAAFGGVNVDVGSGHMHIHPPPAYATVVEGRANVVDEAWAYADEYLLDRSFGGHDWKAIRSEYVPAAGEDIDDASLTTRIKKMYKLLGDKYSRALSVKEAEALMARIDITGIGINLKVGPGNNLFVMSVPSPESSAGSAGVRFGDQVVEINGISMEGKTPFDALEAMEKGDQGKVEMKLRHESPPEALSEGLQSEDVAAYDAQPYRVELQREFTADAPLQQTSMQIKGADGNIEKVGYVKLSTFNSVSKKRMREVLSEMEANGVDAYAHCGCPLAERLSRATCSTPSPFPAFCLSA